MLVVLGLHFEERDAKIRVEDQVGVVLELCIYIGNTVIEPAVRPPRKKKSGGILRIYPVLNDTALDALHDIEIPVMRLAQGMENAYVRLLNLDGSPPIIRSRINFLQHRQCAVDVVLPRERLDHCGDEN